MVGTRYGNAQGGQSGTLPPVNNGRQPPQLQQLARTSENFHMPFIENPEVSLSATDVFSFTLILLHNHLFLFTFRSSTIKSKALLNSNTATTTISYSSISFSIFIEILDLPLPTFFGFI